MASLEHTSGDASKNLVGLHAPSCGGRDPTDTHRETDDVIGRSMKTFMNFLPYDIITIFGS